MVSLIQVLHVGESQTRLCSRNYSSVSPRSNLTANLKVAGKFVYKRGPALSCPQQLLAH